MAKYTTWSLFLFLTSRLLAANYYLSNNGNDNNSGISQSDAWQTINKLNATVLQPGDSVLFECGGIFRGEIIVGNGGTESALIYFGKYGVGAFPIISGAEEITGWNLYSDNIYSTPVIQSPVYFFLDDHLMTIARYPNEGFLIRQEDINGYLGFVDNWLTQPSEYWKGANVRMRVSDRTWEISSVNHYANDSILFQTPSFNFISPGFGYYFDNLFSLLDTAGEWYYDGTTQTLYFNSPDNSDPSLSKCEASVYGYGMQIQNNVSNIKVEGIEFQKQKNSGVYIVDSCSKLTFSNCLFNQEGESGIVCLNGGNKLVVSNCDFNQCLVFGFNGGSVNHSFITKSNFHSIGLKGGFGFANESSGFAITVAFSSDVRISNNLIDSTGSGGVKIEGVRDTIDQNIFMNNFLEANNYGVIVEESPFNSQNIVRDNFIFSPVGSTVACPPTSAYSSGIYLSDSCTQCLIHHNTIVQTSGTGILFNSGANGFITQGNVIYGCKESQIKFSDLDSLQVTNNNQVTGNIFYAISEEQDDVCFESRNEEFMPAVFDSNYYFNPYDFFAFKSVFFNDTSSFQFFYTLKEWRKFSNQDASSKTTFFFRNRYQPQGTNGGELISNGEFTNNVDGWTNITPLSLEMLLDNSTSLDNGCLKLQRTIFNFGEAVEVSSHPFPVDSGQCYLVSFSAFSPFYANVMLIQKTTILPTAILDLQRTFPLDTGRIDYGITFLMSKHDDACKLDLFLQSNDTTILIDNISIKAATSIYYNPLKLSRLFVNYDSIAKTFSLGDSVFFDLNQNVITGSLTLSPYSSVILIFDSSLILSNETLTQTTSVNHPILFPSITTSQSIEHLIFNDALSYNILVQLFSLDGRKINEQSILKSENQFSFSLPRLTPGIYLLRVNGNSKTYSWKIIVQ